MAYSGFHISLETRDFASCRFVTPAILSETVAAMITIQQEEDPADEITVKVYWGEHTSRPSYTVEEALKINDPR